MTNNLIYLKGMIVKDNLTGFIGKIIDFYHDSRGRYYCNISSKNNIQVLSDNFTVILHSSKPIKLKSNEIKSIEYKPKG